MLSFNLPVPVKENLFFAPGMSLCFWHSKLLLLGLIYFFFPFGEIRIIILFPSKLGAALLYQYPQVLSEILATEFRPVP
jgi:hypothetical protein